MARFRKLLFLHTCGLTLAGVLYFSGLGLIYYIRSTLQAQTMEDCDRDGMVLFDNGKLYLCMRFPQRELQGYGAALHDFARP
jgi:hypothetical protein